MTFTTATQFRRGVAPLPPSGTAALGAVMMLCALSSAPEQRPSAQGLTSNAADTRYVLSPPLGIDWQRRLSLINLDVARLEVAMSVLDRNGLPGVPRTPSGTVQSGEMVVFDLATAMDSDATVLHTRSASKYAAYLALTSPDRRKFEVSESIGRGSLRQTFPVLVRRAPMVTTLTLFNPGNAAAGLTIVGVDSNGLELGRTSMGALAAGNSQSVAVTDLFEATVLDQVAAFNVLSDVEVAGVQTVGIPNGDIAQLPGLQTTSTDWRFPVFSHAEAVEAWTSVGVFNPRDGPVTITVEALGPSGQSLGTIDSATLPSHATHALVTENMGGVIPSRARFVRVIRREPDHGYEVIGAKGTVGLTAATGIRPNDFSRQTLDLIGSPDGATLALEPGSTFSGTSRSPATLLAASPMSPTDPPTEAASRVKTSAAAQAAKTFIVNSAADTDDFDPGNNTTTLREALREADGTPELDEIRFNIPGDPTIFVNANGLLGSLGVVQPAIIDATTQPGRFVVLDGSMGGAIPGFELVGAGSTLKGFVIRNFSLDGVVLRPSGAPFTGNNIVDDNSIASNGGHGVHITGSSSNVIGELAGNIITKNKGDGVRIEGQEANGNRVSRNAIGTNFGQFVDEANDGNCVVIQNAPNTTIGTKAQSPAIAARRAFVVAPTVGPLQAQQDGNILSGKKSGVTINGGLAEFTRLSDNLFGTEIGPARLKDGIIHRGGDLLSIDGNTFFKVDEIEIDAEFSVGTSYNIKSNQLLSHAEVATKLTVTGDLTAQIDFLENVIRNADNALVATESIASGTLDWNIVGTDAKEGKLGANLKFRAGGTKHIEGGIWDGYAEGTFKVDQDVGLGVLAKFQIMGGVYRRSGTIGDEHPGVEGIFQANASFPIDILNLTSNGNAGDGMALSIVPRVGVRVAVTASDVHMFGNAGFGIAIRNGTTLIDVISVEAERDFLNGNTRGGWFLFGVQKSFSLVDNSILDNAGPGVVLGTGTDMGLTGNTISGNDIGILIQDNAKGTITGNVITQNRVGIATVGTGTAELSANALFANSQLGIDLGNDGVSLNDPGDADGHQNFPMLLSATFAGETVVEGTLDSTPNESFTLEFFSTAVCDPSGFGEGQTSVSLRTVTTDATGRVTFTAPLPTVVPAGMVITALATNAGGSTSEFSGCVEVQAAGAKKADLAVHKTGSPAAVRPGSSVTYSIAVTNQGPDAATDVVATDTLPADLSFVSCAATGGGICGGTSNNRHIAFASIASGASASVVLVAIVSASAVTGATISNTASVLTTGDATDPNSANNVSTATTTVAAANTPPAINGLATDKSVLWPPNHKMVTVTVAFTATDDSGLPVCDLSVSSSEPSDGRGDGHTATDWLVVDAHHVLLRAERAGNGRGRIYTIQLTCHDVEGLSTRAQVAVTVPKAAPK
jgi:uncharacterized repeat protein (TIGR01451 family)